jgi:hypothetical protein
MVFEQLNCGKKRSHCGFIKEAFWSVENYMIYEGSNDILTTQQSECG